MKKGGDDVPALQTRRGATRAIATYGSATYGSAKTFSTPESFGMLFHGSPHRSP